MRKHILVVEDSMPAMMVEKMLMSSLNCEVDCAKTGKEALLLVEQTHANYNLILMDLGLPDMDGLKECFNFKYFSESICSCLVHTKTSP